MHFRKFTANGNDFLVLDGAQRLSPAQRALLCNRHFGIGADGILEILPPAGTEAFTLRYYNADGKEGSFCGNASRVALFIAQEKGWTKPHHPIIFLASDGLHYGQVNPIKVELCIRKPLKIIEVGYWIDTGSPHVLIADKPYPSQKAQVLRQNYQANITFYWQENGQWYFQTYERGVEAYTQSCGTGAVAVAALLDRPWVELRAPGGILKVEKKDETSFFLQGDVREICRGELAEGFFG